MPGNTPSERAKFADLMPVGTESTPGPVKFEQVVVERSVDITDMTFEQLKALEGVPDKAEVTYKGCGTHETLLYWTEIE